jgi:hypothetical protein
MDDNKNKLPYVKPTIRPLDDPPEEIKRLFQADAEQPEAGA